MDVIGAVFEGSNAKRVVQKIFDEPHDCTGLHFIHRERKVAQSQLGSINLEERERNREKNKKKTLIWSSKQKAVDRNGELYEVTFT